MKRERGASTIETAMTITVIAILISGFATGLYLTVADSRKEAVLAQLDLLKKAVIGEGRAIPPGEKSIVRHGYAGDMGGLPATLDELLTGGTQPEYSIDSFLQIGSGWRGPYLPGTMTSSLTDPWGQGFVYSTTATTSTLTGTATAATIRSLGGDGQNGTADDHVVEIYGSEAFSKVLGYVKDHFGSTIAGVTVKLSYPSAGAVASAFTVTDNEGLYSFESISQGQRVIELTPKLSYMRSTGFTTGNDRNNIEFTVENLAKLATTVSSIKLTYSSNPTADYQQIVINGTSIPGSAGSSGTTVTFSARTADGTGVDQEAFRVDIAGQVMFVPDAGVSTVGTGGTLKIQINDFEEAGTNNNVDVTGVTFTVEFSDGSKTLFAPVRK